MEYALIALALLATVVGIRGDTWSSDRRGWRRVSAVGWIAVSLAVLVAAASTYLEYDDQRKLREEARDAERLRRDGLAQMALMAANLEFIRVFAPRLDKDREVRDKAASYLEMAVTTAEQSLEIYSVVLNRDEKSLAAGLLVEAQMKLAGLKGSIPGVDGEAVKKFAERARNARRTFCRPVLDVQGWCQVDN